MLLDLVFGCSVIMISANIGLKCIKTYADK